MFQQVTGVTLPRTAKDMSHLGKAVELADLQPGDLVFFNTRRFAFSHVGIYLGDNQFVHAPRRGREVEVATLDSGFWQRRFNGARRLAGVLPSLLPTLVGEAVARAPTATANPDGGQNPPSSRSGLAGAPLARSGALQPFDDRRFLGRAAPSRARSRRSGCGD